MAKVLIVDNASFMRSSLKYLCETAGHEVVGMAADGKEAVEMYERVKPDVVTMDILMEEMDGITALENIRRKDPAARVIMVTALGHEQKQDEARKLGAVGYIRKPFKSDEVASEIARAMGKQ